MTSTRNYFVTVIHKDKDGNQVYGNGNYSVAVSDIEANEYPKGQDGWKFTAADKAIKKHMMGYSLFEGDSLLVNNVTEIVGKH